MVNSAIYGLQRGKNIHCLFLLSASVQTFPSCNKLTKTGQKITGKKCPADGQSQKASHVTTINTSAGPS